MDGGSDPDDMHREVGWMVAADVSILRLLHAARDHRGRPLIFTPGVIASNTGYSRQHISARCQVLAEHDLLERVDRGEYRITDVGLELMSGDIDPSDVE